MKNTENNSVKSQAQSAAITTVKAIVYPVHLVCQTTADLLSIGQAQVINKIDGTPVIQSVMECQSWTQEQQAKVVGKAMAIKDKYERQREANRQQDAARLRAKLDIIEGVEHITTTNASEFNKETEKPVSTEPIVPAPPVEDKPKRQSALSKAIAAVEAKAVPLMSPQAVFEPAV
jgi:hypothetical protein